MPLAHVALLVGYHGNSWDLELVGLIAGMKGGFLLENQCESHGSAICDAASPLMGGYSMDQVAIQHM